MLVSSRCYNGLPNAELCMMKWSVQDCEEQALEGSDKTDFVNVAFLIRLLVVLDAPMIRCLHRQEVSASREVR